jgi:hypothetical protein
MISNSTSPKNYKTNPHGTYSPRRANDAPKSFDVIKDGSKDESIAYNDSKMGDMFAEPEEDD